MNIKKKDYPIISLGQNIPVRSIFNFKNEHSFNYYFNQSIAIFLPTQERALHFEEVPNFFIANSFTNAIDTSAEKLRKEVDFNLFIEEFFPRELTHDDGNSKTLASSQIFLYPQKKQILAEFSTSIFTEDDLVDFESYEDALNETCEEFQLSENEISEINLSIRTFKTFELNAIQFNARTATQRQEVKILKIGDFTKTLKKTLNNNPQTTPADEVLLIKAFQKYADIETKLLPPKNITPQIKCDYSNHTKTKIEVLDSTWFTNLVKSESFKVRGFFRLQACGPNHSERKLVWINEFTKNGYTSKAKMSK